MKLELSSNIFSVKQPDTYWEFEGTLTYLEERESNYHAESRYIAEQGQGDLFNGKYGELTVVDPDWKNGHYEWNFEKTCKVLSEVWVDMFIDQLHNNGVKAKAKMIGVSNPKEYNFAGDAAKFNLTISKPEVNRLIGLVRNDPEFHKYVKAQGSYDGFISFMPSTVGEWIDAIDDPKSTDYERAVWEILDYLLFVKEKQNEEFNLFYEENACEALSEADIWDFVEDEADAEADAI